MGNRFIPLWVGNEEIISFSQLPPDEASMIRTLVPEGEVRHFKVGEFQAQGIPADLYLYWQTFFQFHQQLPNPLLEV